MPLNRDNLKPFLLSGPRNGTPFVTVHPNGNFQFSAEAFRKYGLGSTAHVDVFVDHDSKVVAIRVLRDGEPTSKSAKLKSGRQLYAPRLLASIGVTLKEKARYNLDFDEASGLVFFECKDTEATQ